MGMSRAQKKQEIQELSDRFSSDELVVVTHYSGLSVAEMSDLRSKLREEGASFKVTKNALAKIAIKGTQFEALDDMFAGPTGVASSQDSVAAAKAAYNFASCHLWTKFVPSLLVCYKLRRRSLRSFCKRQRAILWV